MFAWMQMRFRTLTVDRQKIDCAVISFMENATSNMGEQMMILFQWKAVNLSLFSESSIIMMS